jgi:preprotein translocase SecE subunit
MEMKKVSWPTKDHVTGSTLVVGIAGVALIVMVGLIDLLLSRIVRIFVVG